MTKQISPFSEFCPCYRRVRRRIEQQLCCHSRCRRTSSEHPRRARACGPVSCVSSIPSAARQSPSPDLHRMKPLMPSLSLPSPIGESFSSKSAVVFYPHLLCNPPRSCHFQHSPGEYFVVVALSKALVLNPRSCPGGGCLRTFRTTAAGDRVEWVHDTPVEDLPGALCAFQGRLLAGVGNKLRLYDMGKKKLLKKGENRVSMPSTHFFFGHGQAQSYRNRTQ